MLPTGSSLSNGEWPEMPGSPFYFQEDRNISRTVALANRGVDLGRRNDLSGIPATGLALFEGSSHTGMWYSIIIGGKNPFVEQKPVYPKHPPRWEGISREPLKSGFRSAEWATVCQGSSRGTQPCRGNGANALDVAEYRANPTVDLKPVHPERKEAVSSEKPVRGTGTRG
jgi:hypothetical protein